MNKGLDPQVLKEYIDKKYQQGIDDNIDKNDHQMARLQGWQEAIKYFTDNFILVNRLYNNKGEIKWIIIKE